MLDIASAPLSEVAIQHTTRWHADYVTFASVILIIFYQKRIKQTVNNSKVVHIEENIVEKVTLIWRGAWQCIQHLIKTRKKIMRCNQVIWRCSISRFFPIFKTWFVFRKRWYTKIIELSWKGRWTGLASTLVDLKISWNLERNIFSFQSFKSNSSQKLNIINDHLSWSPFIPLYSDSTNSVINETQVLHHWS